MPRSIITLTTDFGPSSPYVAQMKGVILAIHRDVELVDLTHAIPPQQILVGAVTLEDVCHHFPAGTIHIAVVDPGVGGERAVVLAEIGDHFFVAPDNGLLDLVARRTPPARVVRIEQREFWREPVSATFHGRDLMAPVAAHLARGVDFERFGPRQAELRKSECRPPVVESNSATGMILAIDGFGNLLTNFDQVALAPPVGSKVTLQIDERSRRVLPVVSTYSDQHPGTPVFLIGSSGRWEVALVGGNAAAQLSGSVGSRIHLDW